MVLAEEGVRGVSTWGLSDKHSWLSEGDGAGGPAAKSRALPLNRGLPYDTSFNVKPLYWAVKGCLDESGRSGVAYRPAPPSSALA